MSDVKLCGAKGRSGKPCKRPAGAGTDHLGSGRCKHHGGSTPTHVRAAAREQAADLARVFGWPVEIAPEEALLQELARSNGIVAWLADQVAELEEQDAAGPVGHPDHHNRAEPHVWIRLLADERDRLTRTAKLCIDAGLDERRVRLAEQQGAMLAGVLRAVLTRLGVIDHPQAGAVVREELTRLAGRGELEERAA